MGWTYVRRKEPSRRNSKVREILSLVCEVELEQFHVGRWVGGWLHELSFER